MRLAAIDIGTNTLLLLVAEVKNNKIDAVICDEHKILMWSMLSSWKREASSYLEGTLNRLMIDSEVWQTDLQESERVLQLKMLHLLEAHKS